MRSMIIAANAGELSPKMTSRIDVDQYSKGCKTLENFFITPYGSVERRPGTHFIAEIPKDVKLVRFVYSAEKAYICVFSDYIIDFYYHDELVATQTSPYDHTHFDKLKYIQSADVMIFVHPDLPVYELRRIAEHSFEIIKKEFKYPPMLDTNIDNDHNLRVFNTEIDSYSKDQEVTIISNKDFFTENMVGACFQLTHVRSENELNADFNANEESDVIEIFGAWTFNTHGTWTGTLRIMRSDDLGETWEVFRTFNSANDSNYTESYEELEEEIYYKMVMEDYEQSSTGTIKFCRAQISNPELIVRGVVETTEFIDTNQMLGIIRKRIYSSAPTNEWSESAFSPKNGYPCALTIFEERMVFAGSKQNPNRIFFSKSHEWDNFLIGANDNDAIDITLASNTVNEISWLLAQNDLVIGTLDSEWVLSANGIFTPSNLPSALPQSVFGSAPISAFIASDVVMFVQRKARKLRNFIYSNDRQCYAVGDITAMAEHITMSGIKEVAVQQLPDTIIWCLLNNGKIAALTYEQNQGVQGWTNITTDGEFYSLAVLPSADGEDVIYAAVKRNNNMYLEKFAARDENFYLDCGGNFDLNYTSRYSPMPIEVQTEGGYSLHLRKKINSISIRLYDSVGCKVKLNNGRIEKVIARDVSYDKFDADITPKTDVVTVYGVGDYLKETAIEILQDEPLPLNIASVTVNLDICE